LSGKINAKSIGSIVGEEDGSLTIE